MLKFFKSELTDEIKSHTKREYWDRISLKSDLDTSFYRDLCFTEDFVNNNDVENISYVEQRKLDFEKTSREFAADWWDEDIESFRSGYQWESDFYKKLANILDMKKQELIQLKKEEECSHGIKGIHSRKNR